MLSFFIEFGVPIMIFGKIMIDYSVDCFIDVSGLVSS